MVTITNHIYAAYKRLTSGLKKYTDWKQGDEKKVLHVNGNEKKARATILVSGKIDFKTETVTKDKESYYIMIEGSVKENITAVYIYAPNIWAPKYIKQIF